MKRFTLRDLFWLTLAVALCLTWWVDRRHLTDQVEKVSLQLRLVEMQRDLQQASKNLQSQK